MKTKTNVIENSDSVENILYFMVGIQELRCPGALYVGETADTKMNTNDKTDTLEDTVYNRPKTYYAEILVNDK